MAFESGAGQDRNLERAAFYFQLSANSGHVEAHKKALHYHMKGHGLELSRVHAKQMMREAAEEGNREAKL